MRHIDHIVVAVRELDEAAEVYRRLGFQVGARNRHPWGTENRLIQFRSSFIELITVGKDVRSIPPHQPRRFSFGAFVRDYLREREGLAMLALNSAHAKADAVLFTEKGIGDFEPFSFERKGRRPDGRETHVAFSLAYTLDARAPKAVFFVCQQHFPENFWNADFQRHANGATNVSAVTLTAPQPQVHAAFLAAFSGAEQRRGPGGNLSFPLDGGRVDLLPDLGTPDANERSRPLAEPLFTSFSVQVGEIGAQADALQAAGIPFAAAGNRVTVPPHAAFGVEITFESA